MSGQVIRGGVHGPGASFPPGTVFIGATFLATSYFGEGSIFIDCTWKKCCPKRYRNPQSVVGSGAVVKNGRLERVRFEGQATFENPTIGWSVSLGPDASVDTGGQTHGASVSYSNNRGGSVQHQGQVEVFDPCKIDPCDPNQQYPQE